MRERATGAAREALADRGAGNGHPDAVAVYARAATAAATDGAGTGVRPDRVVARGRQSGRPSARRRPGARRRSFRRVRRAFPGTHRSRPGATFFYQC